MSSSVPRRDSPARRRNNANSRCRFSEQRLRITAFSRFRITIGPQVFKVYASTHFLPPNRQSWCFRRTEDVEIQKAVVICAAEIRSFEGSPRRGRPQQIAEA